MPLPISLSLPFSPLFRELAADTKSETPFPANYSGKSPIAGPFGAVLGAGLSLYTGAVILCQTLSCASLWLGLLMAQPTTEPVQRLPLADCDDVAFGPGDDLYLACHSPSDRFDGPAEKMIQADDPMDAYVVRISGNTGKVVYAKRFSGAAYDGAWRIAVDREGNAYATGLTKSRNFPVARNALMTAYGGGEGDAFLVKIAPDGQLLHSTFIGGSGMDIGDALALNGDAIYLGHNCIY